MRLERVNTGLFIAIIVINGYIVCAPLLPVFRFWYGGHVRNEHAVIQHKIDTLSVTTANSPAADIPVDNRLLIPSMQLDEAIHEGPDARTLNSGPWRRPNTSTPDKGGNTVIAAHRFTYTQPQGSFYHLDAIKVGDSIGVFWRGELYHYVVSTVKTTSAAAVDIETPTTDAQLTLYTCTPLWLPKDRLVVIASRKEQP